MKLQDPYTGAIVIAKTEEAVERLKARGFCVPKGTTKPKAELLAEAEETMTNAELTEAVEKAKKSPAKPRRKKD